MESEDECIPRDLFRAEPLFEAIRAGDSEELARLLQEVKRHRSVILDCIEEFGDNMLLHVAAREGHQPIVELLVKEGLDIDARNGAGKTALHIAVWKGHREVVSFLLEAGADIITYQDHRGRNALMTAAIRGDGAMVGELLDYIDDKIPFVDECDADGHSALWHAVVEGHADVCRQLVMKGGANIWGDHGSPVTLHDIALAEGHRDCVLLLMEYENAIQKVIWAVREGDAKELEEVLPSAPSGLPMWVWKRYDREETLLLMAARAGHVDVARVLVDLGVDIDHLSSTSWKTPLLEAVLAGHVAMASFLLKEGANIKGHMNAEERFKGQERDYGMPEDLSLLCHAAAKGDVAMVRAIIGATDEGLDVRDGKYGRTALWLASHGGFLGVVKVLLGAGADTTIKAMNGTTPLDVAKTDEIRAIIQEVVDRIRQLSEACAAGRVEEVQTMLASHPHLVNGRRADKKRQTLMMAAAEAGQEEVLQLLAEEGGLVDMEDHDGVTALMLAATNGHLEVVKWLLDCSDVHHLNRVDSSGRSALLQACAAGQMEVAKLLLDKGAKREIPSKEKEGHRDRHYEGTTSALTAASRGGRIALVELLLTYEWSEKAWIESLLAATKHQHVAVVACLLRRKPKFCLFGLELAMESAAEAGHMEMIRVLLTVVEEDKLRRRGFLNTCLGEASDSGQMEVLRGVLKMGALIRSADLRASSQSPECMELFEEVTSVRDAFREAAGGGDIEAMSSLVQAHGKDSLVNTRVEFQGCPLQAAVKGKSLEAVTWLLEQGAWLADSYSWSYTYNWTAVTEAVKAGEVSIVRVVAAEPARRGIKLPEYATEPAFLLACEQGRADLLDLLLESKCSSPKWWFHEGLVSASEKGHLDVVRRLLQVEGQDLNNDVKRRTALGAAASGQGHLEVVLELLAAGADPDADAKAAFKHTTNVACVHLLLRARVKRAYLLLKARCIHGAATVVPACLDARAAEGLMPLPTVEVSVPAEDEEAGGEGKKRKRQEDVGLEVVCEAARFVVEELKVDLLVELMEMMIPSEEQAQRLLEARLADRYPCWTRDLPNGW